MNEIELLKRLVKLEQQEKQLKMLNTICSENKKIEELKEEMLNVQNEIGDIKQRLVKIPNKSFSQRAKESMIKQIEIYVSEINDTHPSLKLSKSQGMKFENYLFSEILIYLNYHITEEVLGFRVPVGLHYTTSEEDSVEIRDLIDFLDNEIRLLKEIKNPNFITLRQFYNDLDDRMRKRFIK